MLGYPQARRGSPENPPSGPVGNPDRQWGVHTSADVVARLQGDTLAGKAEGPSRAVSGGYRDMTWVEKTRLRQSSNAVFAAARPINAWRSQKGHFEGS